MSTFSVRYDGEKVAVGLQKLGHALPDVTDKDMVKAMAEARQVVSGGWPAAGSGLSGSSSGSYTVPERPGQTYVRTGNHGRSTYVVKDGLSYRLLTNALSRTGFNYGPLLTGDATGARQAWWARGRWPVAAVEVRNIVLRLVQTLDKSIARAAEAVGL